jgi:hypothetical protein
MKEGLMVESVPTVELEGVEVQMHPEQLPEIAILGKLFWTRQLHTQRRQGCQTPSLLYLMDLVMALAHQVSPAFLLGKVEEEVVELHSHLEQQILHVVMPAIDGDLQMDATVLI